MSWPLSRPVSSCSQASPENFKLPCLPHDPPMLRCIFERRREVAVEVSLKAAVTAKVFFFCIFLFFL